MSLKQASAYLIFCVAAGALGCGRNLSPGTGGAAGTGSSSCPNLEVNRFAACWDRPLGPSSEDRVVSDLRFLGTVEPDESYCLQGFPNMVGKTNFPHPTAPFVAWEFEDAMGERVVLQFAVEGATSALVSPGDVLDFKADGYFDLHGAPRGGPVLERAGAPVIGFKLDVPMAWGDPYGLVIESADAMCAEEQGVYCFVDRAIQVTSNGESQIIPVDASRVVGGVTVFNAHFSDNGDCDDVYPEDDWSRLPRPSSEIAFYTAREPEE